MLQPGPLRFHNTDAASRLTSRSSRIRGDGGVVNLPWRGLPAGTMRFPEMVPLRGLGRCFAQSGTDIRQGSQKLWTTRTLEDRLALSEHALQLIEASEHGVAMVRTG